MDISISKKEKKGQRPNDSDLGFGTIFTDHMFNMDYSPEKGWHDARIEPLADLSLSPATMALHYGQAIFEGLKAYKTSQGEIQLFRARDNFKRLNRSAAGLCIPELDIDFLMDALKELLKVEKEWIPTTEGTSLYIRPTIIATDPFLGVRASHTYRFFIILSPVGSYYAAGFNPVKIWVSTEHVRAVRGGVGEFKTAGNYAASLFASEKAKEEGYAQVLWLDAVERKYIEEVGAMNIFFNIGDEIITPELNGSILPGITRDSVLQIARQWGMKAVERKVSMEELLQAYKEGRFNEAFGSGTAAVISPVGTIHYGDTILEIGGGKTGPMAKKFQEAITSIQYGKAEDKHGWIEAVE